MKIAEGRDLFSMDRADRQYFLETWSQERMGNAKYVAEKMLQFVVYDEKVKPIEQKRIEP